MSLPHNFESKSRLEEYFKCIRALKVGDKVEFFIDTSGYHKSVPQAQSNFGHVVMVDDRIRWREYPSLGDIPCIVIGSDCISFYRLPISPGSSNPFTIAIRTACTKFSAYKYTGYYWLHTYGPLLKRIIRS